MKAMRIIIEEANPFPLYRQLGEQIKSFIIKNGIKEGTLLPDIKTIASIAGVSIKTAERGLNELIKAGICFRRPKKGTFVGSLKNAVKKRVCGIYHSNGFKSFENNVIQSAMYRGITTHGEKKKVDLFFITPDIKENISFYLAHNELDFRGVITFRWKEKEIEVKDLAEKFPDIKFVFLNYYLDGFENTPSNVYGIFNDDYAGAYQMTEHLIEKGHRRIAIFSAESINKNYRQRIKGYRQSLEDNGIRFGKNLVYTAGMKKAVDLREVGKDLSDDFINSGRKATAIFCINDIIASGTIEYLRSIGKDKEIEVAGYDNVIPHISKDYNFSTVKVDFEKMGIKAIDILTSKKDSYPKILRINPQLIVRKQINNKNPKSEYLNSKEI